MYFEALISNPTKNIDFEKKSGDMIFFIFENAWEVKRNRNAKIISNGDLLCKIMRVFKIWSQNSNRITFDSFAQIT